VSKVCRGRPRTFTLSERREIKKIAKSKPTEHELPFSTWSLTELADFLVAEGVVDDISHEGLRILLREEGVGGFNWSSQHLVSWRFAGGCVGSAAGGQAVSRADVLAGSAECCVA
jgi:hypothetical protein